MKALLLDLIIFGCLFAWAAGQGRVTLKLAIGTALASIVLGLAALLVGRHAGDSIDTIFLFDGPASDARFGALWAYSFGYFSLLSLVHLWARRWGRQAARRGVQAAK